MENKFGYFKNANGTYSIFWGIEKSSHVILDVKKIKSDADWLCDFLNKIVCVGKNPDTSDEALHIGSVGEPLSKTQIQKYLIDKAIELEKDQIISNVDHSHIGLLASLLSERYRVFDR